MVTVSDFKRCVNANGEPFNALVLMGGITFVKSSKTNDFYCTAMKCSMPTTFNEDFCSKLIGQTLPGTIERVDCEPYEYTIKQTGEVVLLTFRYRFNPNSNTTTVEETVFAPEKAMVHS